MDVLGLVRARTTVKAWAGGSATTEPFTFLDLTVNGVPLRAQLGSEEPIAECTPLTSAWDLGRTRAWLDALADPRHTELMDQRVGLLYCPQCGDVDCGVLSVRTRSEDGKVHWSQFGWENTYETGYVPLAQGREFVFHASSYDALIASLRRRSADEAVLVPASGHLWWRKPAITVVNW